MFDFVGISRVFFCVIVFWRVVIGVCWLFLMYLVVFVCVGLFERSLILWIQFAVLAFDEIWEFVYKCVKRER